MEASVGSIVVLIMGSFVNAILPPERHFDSSVAIVNLSPDRVNDLRRSSCIPSMITYRGSKVHVRGLGGNSVTSEDTFEISSHRR